MKPDQGLEFPCCMEWKPVSVVVTGSELQSFLKMPKMQVVSLKDLNCDSMSCEPRCEWNSDANQIPE